MKLAASYNHCTRGRSRDQFYADVGGDKLFSISHPYCSSAIFNLEQSPRCFRDDLHDEVILTCLLIGQIPHLTQSRATDRTAQKNIHVLGQKRIKKATLIWNNI